MQRRQGMKKVFSTRHAYAVSFWSFLMMMTGQSGENAASSGQNSSLMPTTPFDSSGFLLASSRFSADLMQHQDLRIRFYRWHHFHIRLFWYSIMILGSLLPLASFSFFAVLIQQYPLGRKRAPTFRLPARGGANMQVDKGCILGWAGKREAASGMDIP